MKFRYPTHEEIVDPSEKLPWDFVVSFEEIIHAAQRHYRALRRRQEFVPESEFIKVLADLSEAALRALAARDPRSAGAEFRSAVANYEQTALDYAHWLYKDIESGRMLFLWQEQIEIRLSFAVQKVEDERWLEPPAKPQAAARKAPKDFFLEYRANNPNVNYDQMATRIGIARDSLFKIKDERGRVRDEAYLAVAQFLDCRPEDLHPRHLGKLPRKGVRKKSD